MKPTLDVPGEKDSHGVSRVRLDGLLLATIRANGNFHWWLRVS